MKRIRLALLFVVLSTAIVGVLPATAITNGSRTDANPETVLIVMDTAGGAQFRCSGALMKPDIVLTAGHCTDNFGDTENGAYVAVRVFPSSNVQAAIDANTTNYPDAGADSIEADNWAAHPLYESAPFFVHDVGMIHLEDEVTGVSAFATLPAVNALDALSSRRGHQERTFHAVGYGLQLINPVFVSSDRARYEAFPKLDQINVPGFTGDFSLLLSNNHSTGGTCFGDSGGPNYWGTEGLVVAGVTSFGINGNCAGTGGVFRMDREDVQDFVNGFIDSYYP